MESADLHRKLLERAFHNRTTDHFADWQRPDPERRNSQFGKPFRHLGCRACINDPPKSNPAMGGRAHGAVFARGIHRGRGTILGIHVVRSPSGDGELRVLRVVAPSDAVMVFEQNMTLRGHKHRAEWLG